jgi:hypothetical protein
MNAFHYGPDNPEETYVLLYPENKIDLGEVVMNYAAVGNPAPRCSLVPAQTESRWGHVKSPTAGALQCFAVDPGPGRPRARAGTLDNMGTISSVFLPLR